MPEEFENIGFALKIHQMFSVHTTLEEFKNATITGHFGCVFKENLVMDYREYIIFKNSIFKIFLSTRKQKACIFKFLWLEESFQKA